MKPHSLSVLQPVEGNGMLMRRSGLEMLVEKPFPPLSPFLPIVLQLKGRTWGKLMINHSRERANSRGMLG